MCYDVRVMCVDSPKRCRIRLSGRLSRLIHDNLLWAVVEGCGYVRKSASSQFTKNLQSAYQYKDILEMVNVGEKTEKPR